MFCLTTCFILQVWIALLVVCLSAVNYARAETAVWLFLLQVAAGVFWLAAARRLVAGQDVPVVEW